MLWLGFVLITDTTINKEDKGCFIELILLIPELPGIILLVVGLIILYCSKKGMSGCMRQVDQVCLVILHG